MKFFRALRRVFLTRIYKRNERGVNRAQAFF